MFKFSPKKKKETLDSGLENADRDVEQDFACHRGKSKVDDEVLDNLEEAFIMSDVGTDTTLKIIERLEERVARDSMSEVRNSAGCLWRK